VSKRIEMLTDDCRNDTFDGLNAADSGLELDVGFDVLRELSGPVAVKLWNHFDEHPDTYPLIGTYPFNTYLRSFYEAQLVALVSGRSAPNMDWMPSFDEVQSPGAKYALLIEERACVHARRLGLPWADAEVVAEQVAIAVERRISSDMALFRRFLREPNRLLAYIRVSTERFAGRFNERSIERTQALEHRYAIDLRVGLEPTEHSEQEATAQAVQHAIENAGLTDVEKRRLNHYLSYDTPNVSALARGEDVTEAAIRASIRNAKKKLLTYYNLQGAPKTPTD